MIGKSFDAWLTALPLGALMGALAYWIAGRWA
jgi:phosphate/sulfate permease